MLPVTLMDDRHLIVGLGNPGAKYADTRHNVGFRAVEALAAGQSGAWTSRSRLQARLLEGRWDDRKVILCQPQTFMNLSGLAVRAVVDYFSVPLERVVVVVDDADLKLGSIRLRPGGSSGGHHGLESIEKLVKTQGFARLRIGIGRASEERRDIHDHVLGRFSSGETPVVGRVMERVVEQLHCWLAEGTSVAMNRFNGFLQEPET